MTSPTAPQTTPGPANTDLEVPQQWRRGTVPTLTGTSTLAALKTAYVRVQVDSGCSKRSAPGARFQQYRLASWRS